MQCLSNHLLANMRAVPGPCCRMRSCPSIALHGADVCCREVLQVRSPHAGVHWARTSSCRLSDSSMKDAEPSRCSDALPSVLSMLTVRPICRCSPPPQASR